VTEDGAETDLDLGHYERFLNTPTSQANNVTTGRVYQTVLDRERKGDFLGKTVQVIPHITDEIKRRFSAPNKEKKRDFILTELGGTVGDIESLPYIEAVRQFIWEMGKENAIVCHLTLIPYLSAAKELKTKPTQHSVKMLLESGIQPDILICRTEHELSKEIRKKLESLAGTLKISIENIYPLIDEVSLVFAKKTKEVKDTEMEEYFTLSSASMKYIYALVLYRYLSSHGLKLYNVNSRKSFSELLEKKEYFRIQDYRKNAWYTGKEYKLTKENYSKIILEMLKKAEEFYVNTTTPITWNVQDPLKESRLTNKKQTKVLFIIIYFEVNNAKSLAK
jgi:hypothetical protein